MCRNFGYCTSLFGLIAQHWKPKYFAGNFDDDDGMGKRSAKIKGRETAGERIWDRLWCVTISLENNEIIRFFLAAERLISDLHDPIFDTRCDIY